MIALDIKKKLLKEVFSVCQLPYKKFFLKLTESARDLNPGTSHSCRSKRSLINHVFGNVGVLTTHRQLKLGEAI